MAEKELKSPTSNVNNGQQNKTINLIRLNKHDGNYDKTMDWNAGTPVGVLRDFMQKE